MDARCETRAWAKSSVDSRRSQRRARRTTSLRRSRSPSRSDKPGPMCRLARRSTRRWRAAADRGSGPFSCRLARGARSASRRTGPGASVTRSERALASPATRGRRRACAGAGPALRAWATRAPDARPDATDAAAAALPKRARPAPQHASPEDLQRLDTLLQQAEGALAEGRLGDMQRPLHAIDAALETLHGIVLPDDLRTRHQALRAEHGRLRGWQQWGGGRARDDLTAEAEELARLTLAAADPKPPRHRSCS